MTSTTARHPLKPKTLTLLELCQSIKDFRNPIPSGSSPSSSNVLTRRVYLHPLIINPNTKHHSLKTASISSFPSFDNDQRHPLIPDRSRDTHHVKNRTSFNGLAVLSSSAPLATRMNVKPDVRHFRDRGLMNAEDDLYSDCDSSTAAFSFIQPSLQSLARGTTSSTHALCTRPSCILNNQKALSKSNRWEKVDVWYNLDQTLQRPVPNNPPSTPSNAAVSKNEIDEPQNENEYSNYNSIQEIKIYKRNPSNKVVTNQYGDDDDDDNAYDDIL